MWAAASPRLREGVLNVQDVDRAGRVDMAADVQAVVVGDMDSEQRRNVLLGVVVEITIDRHNEMNITLAVPVDESLPVATTSPLKRGGLAA